VNIDCPVPGKLEHRLRQNQAISGNHDDVSPKAFKLRLRPRIPQTHGLRDLNASRRRQLLYR
jgi:hypothetical protein